MGVSLHRYAYCHNRKNRVIGTGSGDTIYLRYCVTYCSLDAALIDALYGAC